ncbi:hypothetical protein A3844_26915 [Paenibacillus helianthi]|uniref:Aldolase n=1 Tax=Paenibacillus helianthi TaxID=1349432 RepID=A0ABX3EGU9_9BACL|nr:MULTISPECIES: hypothetical protein [Paenibacillus]OKP80717.1 hypothetical protein A3844_26915 [Paenibacillus helianthi]OKP89127.1 hypothetical protein A3848_16625 [Paenibacillus sp. P32E]
MIYKIIVQNYETSIGIIIKESSSLCDRLIKLLEITYDVRLMNDEKGEWEMNISIEPDLSRYAQSYTSAYSPHTIEHGEMAMIGFLDSEMHIFKEKEFSIYRNSHKLSITGSCENIVYEITRKAIRQIQTRQLELGGGARLHASSFEYNGNGVAVAGNKGAGKTTTLLSMIGYCGSNYITNDVLEIRRGGNDKLPSVNGWPTVCLIGRGTLASISKYSSLLPSEENSGDNSLPKVPIAINEIEQALGTSIVNRSSLRHIIFSRIDLGEEVSSIKSLSYEEGISQISAHFINEDRDHPDWLLLKCDQEPNFRVHGLLEGVHFYELAVGQNLEQTTALIIEKIMEDSSETSIAGEGI